MGTGFGSKYVKVRTFGVSRAADRKRSKSAANYVRSTTRYTQPSGTGEMKFFDTTVSVGTVSAAGNIQPSMNLIPQSVTESGRIGRVTRIRRVQINGEVRLDPVASGAGPPSDRLRFIVYLDKQANGATAQVTDLLETADILSFRNLSNSSRFQVLSDQTKDINFQAGGGDVAGANSNFAGNFKSLKLYKTCNIPVEFSATTGAITEIRSNNIGILLISENATANCKWVCRLRFTDS